MDTQNVKDHQNLKQLLDATATSPDREINISFRDFHSFRHLQKHRDIMYSLIECYQNVFSESDIWNEFYSVGEIISKLKHELSGDCSMRVCLDADLNRVVGFCWAQSLSKNQIFKCLGAVKYVEGTALNEVDQHLETILGKYSAVYLQDLGIDKNYRQSIPLQALILPPIKSTALQSKNNKLIFWSVAETCIAHLSKKVGIKPFFQQDNMLFFCGDLA